MFRVPGYSYTGPLLPLTAQEIETCEYLKSDVYRLSETIGERNVWKSESLESSALYITSEFEKLGLKVEEFKYSANAIPVKNIIGIKLGLEAPEEIIVVGAHYDTVSGSPGADDNASGVAAMLQIARLLAHEHLKKTIHFVAFVNEEPPFFFTQQMGSWQYAKNAKQNNDNIVAMFSLESIGYYVAEPNSQNYPFPFNLFYPSTADFIGFVGNLSSRTLVHKTIASFRNNTQFPSEGISAPGWFPGIWLSDQLSFWRHGYPAVMITGTALYRNPNYHTGNDLPNTLDYDRMARVVYGLSKMIRECANKTNH